MKNKIKGWFKASGSKMNEATSPSSSERKLINASVDAAALLLLVAAAIYFVR